MELYEWLYGIAVVFFLSSFACALLYWIVRDTHDEEDDPPTHI